MAERTTGDELADICEEAVSDMQNSHAPYLTRIKDGLLEAAARLRSMPEGERIEGYIIGRTLMVNDWEHITIRTGDSIEKGREPAVIFIQHGNTDEG